MRNRTSIKINQLRSSGARGRLNIALLPSDASAFHESNEIIPNLIRKFTNCRRLRARAHAHITFGEIDAPPPPSPPRRNYAIGNTARNFPTWRMPRDMDTRVYTGGWRRRCARASKTRGEARRGGWNFRAIRLRRARAAMARLWRSCRAYDESCFLGWGNCRGKRGKEKLCVWERNRRTILIRVESRDRV